MIKRNCLQCGSEFFARSIYSNTKFCSPECRFKSKVPAEFGTKCYAWPGTINKRTGYGAINGYDGEKVITLSTHRLSFSVFNGPIPAGKLVRHICDNRACVNPHHLELGTQADNMQDMKNRGRHAPYTGHVNGSKNPQHLYPERRPKGSSHGAAKLVEEDISYIRTSTKSHAELGRQYNVSPQTISGIRKRKTWTHVL